MPLISNTPVDGHVRMACQDGIVYKGSTKPIAVARDLSELHSA